MGAGTVQEYSYDGASTLGRGRDGVHVTLVTSGDGRDVAAHPHFFSGHVRHGAQAARALLLVADLAATRYYVPAATTAAVLRAADPVVTSGPDVLRFESLSACCGVYARLDLDPGSLDVEHSRTGTTNIDVNAPFRAAMGQVGRDDPLHLRVGSDELRLRTLDGEAVERRVPLPDRWVKGLAEVPAATAGFEPRHEVDAVEARRFLQGLRAGPAERGAAWVVRSGRGLRLTARPTDDAVCLAGPQRLRSLLPILPHLRRLRTYGPPPPAGRSRRAAEPSAWEAVLDEARVVVVISADVNRGFSGEGAVLTDVVEADLDLVDRVEDLLDAGIALAPTTIAERLGVAEADARRALGRLAAAGRVGHDVGAGASFHRVLPFDRSRLDSLHPRAASARTLVDAGAVAILGPEAAAVRSRGVEHRVTGPATAPTCTCPWYGRHRDARGPCKHILAVTIVRGDAP